jgi:hypothetical protein
MRFARSIAAGNQRQGELRREALHKNKIILDYRGIHSGVSFIAGRNHVINFYLDDVLTHELDYPPSYSEANSFSPLDGDRLPSYSELYPHHLNPVANAAGASWKSIFGRCFNCFYVCWYLKNRGEVSV